MFSRRHSTGKQDFIARQLASLMKTQPAEASLAKVAETCGPDYVAEVEAFRAVLENAGQDSKALDASPFQTLKALVHAAPPGAGSSLFQAFNDYLQRSQMIYRTYWAGVLGLIWYLGVLSVIALSLGTLFVVSLLPPMGAVYENHGATLPALTQAFFTFGKPGLPVFAILLIAAVGFMAWSAHRFRHRIMKLAPLPRWPAWVPLFGSIAETYNLGLFLNCARMLRQCGVAEKDAITTAARVSNQADGLSLDLLTRGQPGPRNELTELGIAARLGNLDPELVHQCEQHVATLTRALVSGRERLALLLKLLVYALIAAIVIAIYMPIFQMAAII